MSSLKYSYEPSVVSLPGFTVGGVSYDASLTQIFEQQLGKKAYESVLSRKDEISSRISDDVYLVQVYPRKEGFNAQVDPFTQLIGYLVEGCDRVPEGMTSRSFPDREYVKVTHHGLESELGHTYDFVYGKWIRENGRCPDSFDFEIWDERYKPDQPDNQIDLYVALEPAGKE